MCIFNGDLWLFYIYILFTIFSVSNYLMDMSYATNWLIYIVLLYNILFPYFILKRQNGDACLRGWQVWYATQTLVFLCVSALCLNWEYIGWIWLFVSSSIFGIIVVSVFLLNYKGLPGRIGRYAIIYYSLFSVALVLLYPLPPAILNIFVFVVINYCGASYFISRC